MSIRVIKSKHGETYNCLACPARVDKIVYIQMVVSPKRSEEIHVGFSTYLCEKCFKRIFGADNWLRHWRMNLEEKIIKARV